MIQADTANSIYFRNFRFRYACDGMISILENYNPKDLKENHIFETILCVIAMIFIPLAAKKYDERQETKKNTNFSMDEGIPNI